MARKSSNQLRLIGGIHRGRKLAFADTEGLRPTPDRVRETLFNWLMPILPGARCLDLFAGSGALGLEAVSRGAAEVVMVDRLPRVVDQLRDNLQILRVDNARVIQADALQYLAGPARAFDIVFLDPPYRSGLLPDCLTRLDEGGWLKAHAWIYLEADHKDGLPELPPGWVVYRSKQAGQVGYHLLRKQDMSGLPAGHEQ